MSAKKGVIVCPHAGGVGLTNYVVHCASRSPPSLAGLLNLRRARTSAHDAASRSQCPSSTTSASRAPRSATSSSASASLCLSSSRLGARADPALLHAHRYVSHLHEHFEHPPTINERGFYNVRPPPSRSPEPRTSAHGPLTTSSLLSSPAGPARPDRGLLDRHARREQGHVRVSARQVLEHGRAGQGQGERDGVTSSRGTSTETEKCCSALCIVLQTGRERTDRARKEKRRRERV